MIQYVCIYVFTYGGIQSHFEVESGWLAGIVLYGEIGVGK